MKTPESTGDAAGGSLPRMVGHRGPVVKVGDMIEVGCELTSGEVWWGKQTKVIGLMPPDGQPLYRPKWAKVDKVADLWRMPNR